MKILFHVSTNYMIFKMTNDNIKYHDVPICKWNVAENYTVKFYYKGPHVLRPLKSFVATQTIYQSNDICLGHAAE
jgi:hypothetical protein